MGIELKSNGVTLRKQYQHHHHGNTNNIDEHSLSLKLSKLCSIQFRNLCAQHQQQQQHEQQQKVFNSGKCASPFRATNRRRSLTNTLLLNIDGGDCTISNAFGESPQSLIQFAKFRLLTCFATVHLPKDDKLLFVTRISYGDANPEFQIQLPRIPPDISKCLIKLWWLNEHDWQLLCVYKLRLCCLIGVIESENEADVLTFKENAICAELDGHWYTFPNMIAKDTGCETNDENEIEAKVEKLVKDLVKDLVKEQKSHSQRNFSSNQYKLYQNPIPSYTFDQVRTINNLTNSVKELEVLNTKLKRQIRRYVEAHNEETINNLPNLIIKLKHKCVSLDMDLENCQKAIDHSKRKIVKLNLQIDESKSILANFGKVETDLKQKLELLDNSLSLSIERIYETKEEIRHILKKYVLLINEIIPIKQVSCTSLFSIMGFEFPQSFKALKEVCYYNQLSLKNVYYGPHFDTTVQLHEFNISQINASLGLIAQVLIILAKICSVSLTYKMVLMGNVSYIVEDVNTYPILGKRPNVKNLANGKFQCQETFGFPLFYDLKDVNNENILTTQGSIIMNQEFEYALSLLSRNIRQLISYTKEDIYNADINSVPVESLDDLLWSLTYLELLMTV